MVSLSLCMICMEDEKCIKRSLESIKKFADEIIIIDISLSDKTIQIAREYTDKIYKFNWIDDFSEARNLSFEMAGQDYIMWANTDDIFEESQIKKIIKLKKMLSLNPEIDIVKMEHRIIYNPITILTMKRARILKNHSKHIWKHQVFESIELKGHIYDSDIYIKSFLSERVNNKKIIDVYKSLIDKGISIEQRDKFFYAKNLMNNKKFLEAIELYKNYLSEEVYSDEFAAYAYHNLALIYKEKKQYENYFKSLGKALELGGKRAENLCEFADYFMTNKNYERAIEYYLEAIKTGQAEHARYFLRAFSNYIPYLGIANAYYKMNDYKNFLFFYKKAMKYRKNL